MGVRNLRAICPNCGGKIHTQPKGLGHFTWANSWMLVQTGSECQHCGTALSGKVGPGNMAILAEDADKTWWEREAGIEPGADMEFALDADTLFNTLADTLEDNKHMWPVGRLTKIVSDAAERRLTFKSPMLAWEVHAEPVADECSRLVFSSKRLPGVFADWGERKRVERKLQRAVGDRAELA